MVFGGLVDWWIGGLVDWGSVVPAFPLGIGGLVLLLGVILIFPPASLAISISGGPTNQPIQYTPPPHFCNEGATSLFVLTLLFLTHTYRLETLKKASKEVLSEGLNAYCHTSTACHNTQNGCVEIAHISMSLLDKHARCVMH